MNTLLWRLVDVTVPGRRAPRLDRVTLEIPTGITVILGPSGAGKTTLLNLLVEFERPSQGTVLAPSQCPGESLPGVEASSPGDSPGAQTNHQRLQVFWSPPGHGLWPQLTVAAHLTSLIAGTAAERRQTSETLLRGFDLETLQQAYPGTLSQGERDRLSLARSLASGARILVLDEPLIHVQPQKGRAYWDFFRAWCQNTETSIVLATHDAQLFRQAANHVVRLEAGRVINTGSADES